jgi:hypothetical protein
MSDGLLPEKLRIQLSTDKKRALTLTPDFYTFWEAKVKWRYTLISFRGSIVHYDTLDCNFSAYLLIESILTFIHSCERLIEGLEPGPVTLVAHEMAFWLSLERRDLQRSYAVKFQCPMYGFYEQLGYHEKSRSSEYFECYSYLEFSITEDCLIHSLSQFRALLELTLEIHRETKAKRRQDSNGAN